MILQENNAPIVMEPQGEGNQGGMMSLQQLFGGGGVQFPPMVDIPPDADDETMVELAIALSLQDQVGGILLENSGKKLFCIIRHFKNILLSPLILRLLNVKSEVLI